MPEVDLVYAPDCPHAEAARAELRRAFAQLGFEPAWHEWRTDDPDRPAHARGHGSPTVLVDGLDVAALAEGGAEWTCRVYAGPGGLGPASPAEAIARALRATAAKDAPPAGASAGRVAAAPVHDPWKEDRDDLEPSPRRDL